jgi:Zn-dependent M16 (insulinase) family peptidase
MFSLQWYAINDGYAEAAALTREMLLNTDLSDADTISGVIDRLKTSTRKSNNDNPHSFALRRARANRYARFAYNDYISGLAYHQFLSGAQKLLENDPEGFAAKLSAVRDKLGFRDNVVVMFAGNAEGIEAFEKNADVLFKGLKSEPVSIVDLSSIPRPAESEGLVIEASVQYNVVFAAHDEIGLKYGGKLLPIAGILSDAYLTPTVRYTIGAYGSRALAGRHGLFFYSYRDPAVAETFAAYKGMADFTAGHNLTQEDIDRYIIRSFSQQIVPEGELSGALNAMLDKYQGYPDDYKLRILREIKSVTVSDLTGFSKQLTLATDKGTRSTAGGQSVILENANLFESVVYPLGTSNDSGK